MDKWHPLLSAIENPTGVWTMVDPQGREYGRIELRRVANGTEARYKAIWRGEVIGWSTSLKTACERVHAAYVAGHGPGGRPMADWGTPWRAVHRPV